MKMEIPPYPTFIVMTIIPIITIIKVLQNQRQIPIVPMLPMHVLGNLLLTLATLLPVISLNAGGGLLARLFGNYQPAGRNNGRNVRYFLSIHPHIFWYMTGETPESFDAIVQRIGLEVTLPRHTPRAPTTARRKSCVLDADNRVLLVIVWLRQYLKLHVLASIFAISKSTVAEEIYHVVPILFTCYRSFITWHSLRRWSDFLDTLPHFPNAVGMIDATAHRIRRPSGPRQADFYRGDKKYHFMSTQLIIDADGLIVLLVAGFPGHLNDAGTYRHLPAIGHGRCSLPRRARLLADGGYANTPPLIKPRRITHNRRQRDANRALRSLRVRIEHTIGCVKIYSAASNIFRHMRPFQPVVVATCGLLTNRRKRILRAI